jgi:hypothetical protein
MCTVKPFDVDGVGQFQFTISEGHMRIDVGVPQPSAAEVDTRGADAVPHLQFFRAGVPQ